VEVVTTAKLITEVVTAAASQVSAASTTILAASATIPAAKPSVPAAAPIVVAAYTRRRKGVIIRDLEEELPLKTPDETPKRHRFQLRVLMFKNLLQRKLLLTLSHPPPTSPSPPSPIIPSSPPNQPPCPPQPQDAKGSSLLFQQVLDTCSALAHRVEGLEHDKAAQQLEIVKLKARVKKLEKITKVKSSKLRRLKKEEGIELVADQKKDAEFEGRHADKQAKIYNIDLDHSSKVLSMQEDDTEIQEVVEIVTTGLKFLLLLTRRRKGVVIRDPEEELSSNTPAETPKVKYKGKGILIETPKPMKKKDPIEMDAEYARKLQEEINKEHEESYKNINWNAALDHVQSKEPRYKKRYHGMKKKPQTKSEARKNMIFYLRNTKGYKMEFFKGLKEDLEDL
nr:hypothetical protein [Tanacetum cinerariifolium]